MSTETRGGFNDFNALPLAPQVHLIDHVRRVLLVGADQQVLEGLKRSLRVFESMWAIESVTFPVDEGIERPDVVIVEARGFAIDAQTVLHAISRTHPRTVRAVLCSTDVSQEVVQRLLLSSHQLIKKPVVPAQLFELVERTCTMVETLGADRLRAVVSRLGAMPSLPQTYATISQMTADPNVSLDAVSSVVERDPAITANVLRIINSAYFGLPRRVSSVRETVRYLGIQSLKNIVLTVEIFEGVASGKTARALQFEALARACAMREVLGRTPMAETAFATGVLSDVGQLLLATRLPLDSAAILKEVSLSNRSLCEVERERLGATHAEIGGALLGMWNLPAPMVEAVLMHHEPPEMTTAANVPTALALVCAIEESMKLPDGDPRKRRLESTVSKLAESFPTANLGAVKRQFASRETEAA